MKIRSGFVSNSSSSSYIIVGRFVEKPEFNDDYDAEDNWDGSHLYIDGQGYVEGEIIADVDSSDYIPEESFTLAELQDLFRRVAKQQKCRMSDLSLLIGTRAS